MAKVKLTLNNETRTIDVEPCETLLDVLRDKLGMKSPKCGCDRGDCGACAVLIDGKSVRSCLIFAIECEGQHITTLEGISGDQLSILQEAFIEFNSFQCGYCAPGVIISATELLKSNPHPNLEEIKEALSGNLCRCTGYQPIFDAILKASKETKK
ncbi:MAG: (2Fe-2S)-binding protein [Candidatus Cloacimonetes bacterium HGW-Cloacimonetes-1]|jgi:carbon-monoxide dehydrogenase small subunit|nr:MAG: (2Fe-2S)-binding protein [Candidatus Cloacimonetes bacterium HGW-Cloacimonetes-1]